MKSAVVPSWHPEAEAIERPEPMDPLERAEWLITACGGGFLVITVMALLTLG